MVKRSLWILVALVGWSGCGDSSVGDDKGGHLGTLVESVVKPQIVVLGQTVSVSCPVFDDAGTLVDEPTRFVVDPAIPPIGSTITPSVAGTYSVACELADGTHRDPSPAMVWAIDPADLDKVQVDTELAKGTAAIGEAVAVTCLVAVDGELVPIETEVRATPDGITVDGHSVTGTADGEFDIACAIPATDFQDPSPALLKVGKGNPTPAKIVTTLDKHNVVAGETVEVTCTVTSAEGDVLELPTLVTAPAGIVVAGHTLTAHVDGEHEIQCELADASGAFDPERVPDTLIVSPAGPVGIEAWVDPDKEVYKPGDQITIKWQGKDTFGNVIPSPPATIDAPSQGVSKLDEAEFELLEDGLYTFTVTLTEGTSPSASLDLIVDGSGPVIVIETPERGMTFDGDGAIEVSGTVTDEFGGVDGFELNGYPIVPDETGHFSFVVSSVQGINPVLIESSDVHGNTSRATVAWYYSTGWVAADKATPDEAWLEDTVRVWLSQSLIDDGDHQEAKIDDLAHLLEILLNDADFAAMLGKPALFEQVFPGVIDIGALDIDGDGVNDVTLVGDLKLWATVDKVTFGHATVSLQSRDGGVDVTATLVPEGDQPGITVHLKVYVQLTAEAKGVFPVLDIGDLELVAALDPPPTIETTSTVTIDELQLDTSFDIGMDANDELQVTGKQLLVVPKGWEIHPLAAAMFDLGDVTFYADVPFVGVIQIASLDLGAQDLGSLVSGIDQLFATVAGPILDTILPLATQILEPLIAIIGGDALEMALKSLEIDQTIAVPQLIEGQPEAELQIKARIADVEFTAAGARLGLNGLAVADKAVERDPLGSILREGCLGADEGEYSLPKAGPMELALSLDLMNEILFGLWYAGSLNLTLDAAGLANLGDIDLSKALITLDALLPPILSDCNSKGTLKMQLGDSHLDVDIMLGELPITFKAWLSAEIDVGMVASGKEIGIVINGVSLFNMEIYDLEGPFANSKEVIEALIETVLLEQLLGQLAGDALGSFPIPEFDISGLAPGVPEGTVLALDELAVKKAKGFLQIEGKLN